MKIVLFDIDGTLLTMGKISRNAYTRALTEVAGTQVETDTQDFVGKTDPQISRNLLSRGGLSGEPLEEAIPRTLNLYLDYFEAELAATNTKARVYPGVPELLAALTTHNDCRVALLTGNVRRGARLKLGAGGLTDWFDYSLSCFGDDDADRYRLPALALERARKHVGEDIRGEQLVVVGDSEHDVLCGRSISVRTVAVGTGWTPHETLLSHQPDRFLPNFSDTARSLEAILDN